MNDIATRLKCALGDTGISQRELSLMTGITEAAISRYVSGSRVPKLTTLTQIAGALGVGLGYFFNPVENEDTQPTKTDTISRRAAIAELDKYAATLNPDKDNKELWRVNSIKSFIKQFPGAQPQRVRGRWEVYQLAELGQAWTVQCSACHAIGFHGKTPYCPECGTQMMEGEG